MSLWTINSNGIFIDTKQECNKIQTTNQNNFYNKRKKQNLPLKSPDEVVKVWNTGMWYNDKKAK